jgi:predicted secreted protein
MTQNVINGTLLGLYLNGTLIAKSTDCKLTINMATRKITNKDSGGWDEHLGAVRSWSVGGGFLDAEDNALGFEDLYDMIVARTGVTMKMSTEVSGDRYYQGTIFVNQLERDAPTEENTTGTYGAVGSGQLSKGTVA